MDPGFFADADPYFENPDADPDFENPDPDPDFENPDPDPFVLCFNFLNFTSI